MLSPPEGGSEFADLLQRLRLSQLALGSAAGQLGTRQAPDEAALLGRVDYDLGVIAGDHPSPLLGLGIVPTPHDGKVSVAATHVAGMRDHLVLPVGHTLMLHDHRVSDAAIAFLANGDFIRW